MTEDNQGVENTKNVDETNFNEQNQDVQGGTSDEQSNEQNQEDASQDEDADKDIPEFTEEELEAKALKEKELQEAKEKYEKEQKEKKAAQDKDAEFIAKILKANESLINVINKAIEFRRSNGRSITRLVRVKSEAERNRKYIA